jgi:hypothetical protein
MTRWLRLSSRIYGGLLLLYPQELRRDFGAEMAAVFAEDLADAWRRQHSRGVFRVWWCSLCEVVRIAVPGHTENPAVMVPIGTFALSAVMYCAFLILAIVSAAAIDVANPSYLQAIGTILWPSAASALVSRVTVWKQQRVPPVPSIIRA